MDDEFFAANFKDIRLNKPSKNDILSCYRAVAYFIDGELKRNILNLLVKDKMGAESSKKMMRKLAGATEQDSVRVLMEMTDDLLSGRTLEEVAQKEYKMLVEYFFWTKKECVPQDDP